MIGPDDQLRIGQLAAELMDRIERVYGDDDVELRSILIAVEVGTDAATETLWQMDPDSHVVAAGLAALVGAGCAEGRSFDEP